MFNTKISLYSIMIILSLISNILVVFYTSKKYGYTNKEKICILLYENFGIIAGAKLLCFLENYDRFNGTFNFVNVGLSSYGAVIGALLTLILFSIQFKKSLKELIFIFMPSIPLMYAIGKVGCFLTGCCYGIEYNGIFKVLYEYSLVAPKDIYLFPIQIVEAISFFAIFIYMIIQHKRNKFTIKTLGIGILLCGIFKFLLDYLRMSHNEIYISTSQIISIIFIFVGIFLINIRYHEETKKSLQFRKGII